MYRQILFALLGTTLLQAETLISWKRVQLTDQFYAECATYADINKDGHVDIISGPFWYAGPDWKAKQAFYEPKSFDINGYSDNFFCYTHDFNADGWLDILVLGFPGKEARLYLNPGKEALAKESVNWPVHVVADVVDNESPVFTDITGDGKQELVCSTGGRFGWYAPNWEKPIEPWSFVPVTGDMKVAKFTHGLGVGDVNGDGKLDLLEARRWWQAGSGEGNWQQHNFAAGVGGGAQMFAYDFDGDGRNDVVTALNAHSYGVAVFMNRAGNEGAQWEKRNLVGQQPWENDYGIVFSQAHAMRLADVDGDGVLDIVTGKRYWAHNGKGDPDEVGARVVYWFQTKRDGKGGVEFVPHLIDDESGVGTDVQVGDVNGDKLPDIVVGNKSGVYVLLQERQEVTAEVAEQMSPKKMYGPGLMAQKDYKAGQSPEEAVKNIQLPAGFKAELIAAEPNVVQPIAMTWDERGRLWVIEGNSYPKPREPGAGQDRILIFEDKDGDGSFETRKVFAEGISLASGIEIGHGGVWVGAAPYFMFIPDADRDDKPDAKSDLYEQNKVPKVPGLNFTAYALLDGWGSQDTHETLNSFIWGPDGWLYGCHGVFTHSKVGKVGTPDDKRVPLNAGVWRYHPTRHEFEIFAHGTSNPWGLDYNEFGEFFVTACVIPHLYHIVPGGRYHRQAGQHFNPYTYEDIKTIADHAHFAGDIWSNAHWGARKEGGVVADDTNQAGGGHAHCGLAIYQGNQFPAMYRGQLLFGNLHGHRLVNNYLDPKGSTYIGRHGSDFMRSNDMYFIPVTQKVGPDGSLYVSDWSDKQVCHRGSNAIEMWDRSNGRIYRISYGTERKSKGFPSAPFDLSKEKDEALMKLAVQTENEWFSRMARRLLTERSANAKIETLTLPNTKGDQGSQLRALWLSHLLHQPTSVVPLSPNQEGDQIRQWKVRLNIEALTEDVLHVGAIQDLISDLVKTATEDKSPVVRRELASGLQRLPMESRRDIATALLQHAQDKDDLYIPLLIWYGIEPVVGGNAAAGMALAKASKIPKVTQFIYRRLAVEEVGRVALLSIAGETKDPTQRDLLIKTVVEAARSGSKMPQPEGWADLRAQLADKATPEGEQLLIELEAFMGVESSLASYREVLMSDAPAMEREKALRILLQVRDSKTLPLLHGLIEKQDRALVRRAVQALATLPDAKTPALLLAQFDKFDSATRNDAIATLATTPDGARALLNAVKDGQVSRSLLSPFLARQMDTLKDDGVKALIKEVWGDLNAPKADLEQRKAKFRASLSAEALARADAVKGKMIYTATCGTCHRLLGEGQDVGPDLTGSNRGDLDYLLDNVLDPNAVIGKDYQLNIFELNDGRVASGVIKEETAAAYRVTMPGGIEQIVKKAEVKKRTLSPMSTMPEGLFDALPADAVRDLVKYLQSGAGASAATPGTQEAETLKMQVTAGQARTQNMGGFKGGQWSSAKHLWWTGGKVGDTLKLSFPVKEAGQHKVFAVFTKAPDYAIVTLKVNGQESALGSVDLYDPGVVNTAEQLLGEFNLSKGEHTLEITIQGRNPAARPALMFGMDYLRVE